MKNKSNRGFGLIEVLLAAVVLGFLIVGLMRLQMGNRETIVRIRARDAANVIAQEVIDSISALGFASVIVGERVGRCVLPIPAGIEDLCRTRTFKGSSGDLTMNFWVTVNVKADNPQKVDNTSDYIKATSLSVVNEFTKRVEVTVNWKFKESTQSINTSTVIR